MKTYQPYGIYHNEYAKFSCLEFGSPGFTSTDWWSSNCGVGCAQVLFETFFLEYIFIFAHTHFAYFLRNYPLLNCILSIYFTPGRRILNSVKVSAMLLSIAVELFITRQDSIVKKSTIFMKAIFEFSDIFSKLHKIKKFRLWLIFDSLRK